MIPAAVLALLLGAASGPVLGGLALSQWLAIGGTAIKGAPAVIQLLEKYNPRTGALSTYSDEQIKAMFRGTPWPQG